MNKASYLDMKRRLKEEAVAFKRERTCFKCYWFEEKCWCHLIEPFATETRFVILMHPKEARKERLGTGRICRATLVNSEIIIGIDFTENAQVNALIRDPGNACMVLYPGEKTLNISTDDIAPLSAMAEAGRKRILFLVDGTWQCAKKMMTLSPNLRSLPRISFTAPHESIFEIKEQPAAYCLSTLESIHFFLNEADRRGVERLPGRPHDNLLAVFKSIINFMLQCALDPPQGSYRRATGGYSLRANRKKRKYTSGRSIVYRD
jgi:DTW domain-containing protein